jgi:cell division protein FtsW
VRAVLGRYARLLDRPLTSYLLVLGTTVLLTVLGLVMVMSASSVTSFSASGSSFAIAQKQAMWVALGLPLLWVGSRLPPRAYRLLAYPLLLASVVLLALTLVPGIGVEVRGNRNWIDFGGPFRLQPSELTKLALVLWGADLLARKRRLLTQWKHLLVPLLPVSAVAVGLVLLEGDLGTVLVLLAIVFALLWVVGAPLRLFSGLAVAVGGVLVLLVRDNPERVSRVTSFLDPFADYENSGWQAAHSFFALASGGWWGLGLGGSREKWGALPEAHTDFIFAIIGEELGLVGTLAVLVLFATMSYAGVRIASRSTDPFVRLAAAAATAWFLVQAMVNMGGVLGVLPITGIPLPLVSYGGSSLLPTLLALGMLLSFAREEPGARAAMARRPPGPLRRTAARLRPSRPAPSPAGGARPRATAGAHRGS